MKRQYNETLFHDHFSALPFDLLDTIVGLCDEKSPNELEVNVIIASFQKFYVRLTVSLCCVQWRRHFSTCFPDSSVKQLFVAASALLESLDNSASRPVIYRNLFSIACLNEQYAQLLWSVVLSDERIRKLEKNLDDLASICTHRPKIYSVYTSSPLRLPENRVRELKEDLCDVEKGWRFLSLRDRSALLYRLSAASCYCYSNYPIVKQADGCTSLKELSYYPSAGPSLAVGSIGDVSDEEFSQGYNVKCVRYKDGVRAIRIYKIEYFRPILAGVNEEFSSDSLFEIENSLIGETDKERRIRFLAWENFKRLIRDYQKKGLLKPPL